MPNYFVFDFETTDSNPMTCYPIQIGLGVWDSNCRELLLESHYINPRKPISEGALKAHGINQWVIDKEGKSLRWFAKYWNKLIWKYKPVVLLGHNAINFDLIILQRMLYAHAEGTFKYPPVERITDTMFLAQRFFQIKGWPKLIDCVNRLGIPHDPDAFHDAKADVKYTWLVYKKIIFGDSEESK